MTNFTKGLAFFIFGVLFSPMCLGLLAPIMAWKLTESPFVVVAVTIISFSLWAFVREAMINRNWHYNI